jgi:hypothetical protein
MGFMALHDDMLDDACNSSTEPGAVARDRLKVDTKKWFLFNMLPKTYGDKIAQEITGKDGEPFYKKETPLETARWIAWILTRGDRELDRNGRSQSQD